MRCRAVWLLSGAVLALAGCERAMQDMYDQPKYAPHEPSTLFADGNSARPLPPGTAAFAAGNLAGTSSGRASERSVDEEDRARDAQRQPYEITRALLERGQERYTIYCAPCHSIAGDGDGLVVRRGFPAPPSYHTDELRAAPDRHFFDVMTYGHGVMHSYADRVAPADRWAIVAYIRALQLSQHARADALPHDVRARLASAPRAGR